MNNKISIIIPVYNSGCYIKKCLDSIIHQTYTNLEILCIDDGSYDDSAEICEEYAAKDSRIRVFRKESKGGYGTPVKSLNIGLQNFTGKYVGFVDPDDWLEPDMYEVLYKSLKSKNVQISTVNYYKHINSKSIPMVNIKTIHDEIISTHDMMNYALKRDYYMGFLSYLWNKLFTGELIRGSGIYFNESIKFGYDTLFYYTLVLSNNCKGVYNNKALYHYLQHDTSLSKSQSVGNRIDVLTVYKRIEKLMLESGFKDDIFWARGFYCYHASMVAESAIESGDKMTFKQMQKEIEKYLEDYIKTNKDFPEKFERIYSLINTVHQADK
jgi:glycosyltransferase involved in cell wall biosynthesis